MMDDDMKEIIECFTASPVAAKVDHPRLWRAIQGIREQERNACAQTATLLAESWGRHPAVRETEKMIAQQVAVLIEAAILQRGEK